MSRVAKYLFFLFHDSYEKFPRVKNRPRVDFWHTQVGQHSLDSLSTFHWLCCTPSTIDMRIMCECSVRITSTQKCALLNIVKKRGGYFMLTQLWHYFPKCQITIFQLYHHYFVRPSLVQGSTKSGYNALYSQTWQPWVTRRSKRKTAKVHALLAFCVCCLPLNGYDEWLLFDCFVSYWHFLIHRSVHWCRRRDRKHFRHIRTSNKVRYYRNSIFADSKH